MGESRQPWGGKNMLLLSKQDIDKIFTMKDAVEADKLAFEFFSQGKSDVPLRGKINNKKYNGTNLFMPGYVEDLDSAGIKIVSVFPDNAKKGKPVVPATMILLDGESGQVNCILDGTYLTQLRTGAAAGAATDVLAKKDAKIGALIGSGGQAEKQLEAILAVRNLEMVKVFSRNYDKTVAFANKMKESLKEYKADIVPVKSADEAILDADIITAITSSSTPVFNGKLVKKGAHINGVGSYTPNMQELDEFIISSADKVFVDSMEAIFAEAGDILIPLEKGLITKDKINGEIGKVIGGEIKGRESEEEITIFKSVGIAVQDIVTGSQIYKKAMALGVGTQIDL